MRKVKRLAENIGFGFGVLLLVSPAIMVFLWMLSLSLKTELDNTDYPPVFIPNPPVMDNFTAVFERNDFLKYAINSIIVSFTATGLAILFGVPAGYGIAKMKATKAAVVILIARITPGLSYLIPLFLLFQWLELTGTLVPIVITLGLFGALGGEPQTWVKGAVTKQMWLQNAGFVWVPFIVLSTLAAWFGMNDLASAKASFADQAVIFKRKHNWLMCWLYIGTFGSFIGFAAGFPLLVKGQFPQIDPSKYVFFGPLVGALARPIGGWLSDKIGGAKVTQTVFFLMVAAVFGVLQFLPHGGQGGNFQGFFAMFLCLFALTGIGNGSTFMQVPAIFLTLHKRMAKPGDAAQKQAAADATKEAAAVLGFSGAIGAYGGFFIPKSYGTSIALTGGVEAALYAFIAFYLSCLLINGWYYARKNAEVPC